MMDKIVSIAYNQKKRMLAAGTKNGFIVMWKCKSMTSDSPSDSEGWEAKPPFQCKIETNNSSMNYIEWGG